MARAIRLRAGWRGLALACIAAGCAQVASDPDPLDAGATPVLEVLQVKQRGPYLDVGLASGAEAMRFFFPADDRCSLTFKAAEYVQVRNEGVFVEVTSDDGVCDAVGVGSLRQWQDRRRRPPGRSVATAAANYRVVYEDPQVWMVRGRFPLAGLLELTGVQDLVAVLPRGATCDEAAHKGSATMEFRVKGSAPYSILHGSDRCPIIGFVRPIG